MTVVRAGSGWWVLAAACVLLNLAFVLVFGLDQPSPAQALVGNRRRREAATIPARLAAPPTTEEAVSKATRGARIRWPAVAGIGGWTALAPVLTLVPASLR